jgi:hypothetical protein
MFNRYRFESEVYESLDRIPLDVRMKLDRTGAKFSLKDWLAFSLQERWALCDLPVEAEEGGGDFISYFLVLLRKYKGEELELVSPPSNPPWENSGQVPPTVHERSKGLGKSVSPAEWAQWDPFQRYALYKLSVSKNEPEQFRKALDEFREGIGIPS